MKSSYRYLITYIFASITVGCSPSRHKAAADSEVYKILKGAEYAVFQKQTDFSINTKYSQLSPSQVSNSYLRENSNVKGNVQMSLDQVLSYATKNSRRYQNEKERLYLTALTLSDSKNTYRIQGRSSFSTDAQRTSGEERIGSVGANNGLSKVLKAGGSISLSLANDLLRYFTGDPRKSAGSVVRVNILKPLLRGRGSDVAAENLTQSYRNVIYSLRNYSHYQNTFSQDIVVNYFQLLQQKREIANELNNFESRKANAEYLRARSVDRASPQEVSDSEQGQLQAKNRYVNAQSRYATALDEFKLKIGMPSGIELKLDPTELTRLEKSGLRSVNLTFPKAYQLALSHRLPFINGIDEFEDSKRQVTVAANQLKTNLNFLGGASLTSTGNSLDRLNLKNLSASVGLELDLPVNRRRERNQYRRSLINFERSIRNLSEEYSGLQNLIKLRFRQLEQSRQNYEIQKGSLALARKRVEGNKLLLKAGRVIFRRLSESQDALISAQNAVTTALVDYQEARLRLYVDIGTLETTKPQYWIK